MSLPATGVKSLGLTDGVHCLEIARCVPLFEYDREGEDIPASDYKQFPLWADVEEVNTATQACISALRLRYVLHPDAIVPIPKGDSLSSKLKDKYLWLNANRAKESAITLAYRAGTGWIPLREWKRCASKHPLILKFMADGLTEGGAFVSLEVEPREYDLLVRRTLERLNQKYIKFRRNEDMKNDMKAAVSPMEMDVRIFPYREDGPVAAIASVTLNGCFAVRDVRIMEGKNGLFVSMPSRKVKGEYRDICYPCTKDFKQQFDQKVLEAYEQAQVQEAQKSPGPRGSRGKRPHHGNVRR